MTSRKRSSLINRNAELEVETDRQRIIIRFLLDSIEQLSIDPRFSPLYGRKKETVN